jgi:hypothetical protein
MQSQELSTLIANLSPEERAAVLASEFFFDHRLFPIFFKSNGLFTP